VLACALARRGFTAPVGTLVGNFGLLGVFGSDKSRQHELHENLGWYFAVAYVWIKVFMCCGVLHSTAQALHTMQVEHSIEPRVIAS
jgi:2-methylcitrate dehydratase PrpD